ncbi:IS66 family transposase [Bradyrhizobium barranii]|uniref:IS66 family transposase n=2 Tax=Bradyrhizobium TaxID=374 RepID=UPI00201C222A|nr:transposase [Bradyrhizobium barranii]
MLDVIPAILRVLRTIRPKYGCRGCTDGVVQAKVLPRLIEGGMASTALVTHVVVSKFAWYLPLYRQVQILAGQGIHLDRATLAGWVKRAAWWLRSLYELQLRMIQAAPRVFCDETPMPVLDPGRHRPRICQFWAHAMDDQPWGGPSPPAVAYVFADGRGTKEIAGQLTGFSGILQVDVCGRPTKCKQNLTSEQACGRVLTCVRPRDATSTRRGPLWNAWIGSNSAMRALWHSSTC